MVSISALDFAMMVLEGRRQAAGEDQNDIQPKTIHLAICISPSQRLHAYLSMESLAKYISTLTAPLRFT